MHFYSYIHKNMQTLFFEEYRLKMYIVLILDSNGRQHFIQRKHFWIFS
uniref:Hypotheticial protein n=1 Tax=Schistosoma japonicum TaxID=6182 RepID=C1LE01_SCHJA|nr:hypotheticial protein [Schistosoma japonicum]